MIAVIWTIIDVTYWYVSLSVSSEKNIAVFTILVLAISSCPVSIFGDFILFVFVVPCSSANTFFAWRVII